MAWFLLTYVCIEQQSRARRIESYMDIQIGRIAVAVISVGIAAQAAAVPMFLDFTGNFWSGAHGQTSFSQTYGSLEVTLAASGPLTFNDHEVGGTDSDGIGIGDDEIGFGEWVEILFSSNVTVLGYGFLDFFAGEGPNGVGERADVNFTTAGSDVSSWDIGVATDTRGGYSRMGLDVGNVSMISLSGALGAYSDFALAGLWIDDGTPVSVPEPGTLGLLGVGFAALAFRTRRKKI
jgi:hypothetical protein